MANPTQSDPSAEQAAALYAEQYQQYTQQYQAYQAWLAANPGYQPPAQASPAPSPTTAAPDYSAYYQQYGNQPATAAPAQSQQPQQAQSAEEYAQQYAAYYAQLGYAVPASSAPPATGAPTAAAAPYNGHTVYQDYYAQQGHQPYSYPASGPAQAPHHQYPGYQNSAPGTQSAPAAPSALTAYPYSFHQQQPHSAYSSPSYSNQGPPGQNGNYSKPYPGQNSSHSGYQSGYQGKQNWHNKPNHQQPFDNQAFQKQKHLEAEQRQKRAREEQDKVHIQQKLHTTTLNDEGYTGTNGANMSKIALEKPAYLSVKSKKVKPLTTNALEIKDASGTVGNGSGSEGWPQSLKDYVQRVFETIADEDRDVAQKELRDLVSKYHVEGTLWDIEWDKMVVPKKYKTKKDKEKEKASRKLSESPEPTTAGEEERRRREKRMRRFEDDKPQVVTKRTKPVYTAPVFNSDVIDWDEYTIVGSSTQLEKSYLRLTSAPDPATVRPVRILQKTLDLLKEKWRQDQNYAYICDQFKSVRQDLTVQRIKSEFTVTVYEIHARIALEKGDLGEYNQCQTQLKQLYEYNLQGHVMEFTAYRILYLLHTRNPSDIIAMLASLTPSQKHDPAVKHALKVRTALASSNYHALFKLYVTAPNMGGYLMDQFVERERVEAMKMICKAYRPNIEVSFLSSTLGFGDELECMGFLKTIGVVQFLNQDSGPGKNRFQFLDTKAAHPYVLEAGKKYQTVDIKGQM